MWFVGVVCWCGVLMWWCVDVVMWCVCVVCLCGVLMWWCVDVVVC